MQHFFYLHVCGHEYPWVIVERSWLKAGTHCGRRDLRVNQPRVICYVIYIIINNNDCVAQTF